MTQRAGERTRVLALVLAMSGVLLASSSGCRSDEAEPVAVARQFADAARRGDVEALMVVIERSAVEQLEYAAERASDQVGGRRAIEPAEMLQIVGVDRTLAVAEAQLVDEAGETATVELTLTDGRTIVVHLVWDSEAGAWKVRVPLPKPDAGTSSSVPSQPDA